MPRDPRPGRRLPDIPTNSLVASAVRFEANQIDRVYWGGLKSWQRECYRHFRICGEARFAARFMGNAMSRVRLGVGLPDANGNVDKTKTSPKAKAALEALFASEAGQSQMLAAVGVHLTIAGECWLVGRAVVDDVTGTKTDVWEIVSVNEMNVSIGPKGEQVWAIDYGDGKPVVPLVTGKDVVIRIWLPDPAKRIEADSPFRSLLPVLNEIEWATKHLFAQMRSRLATAGIFAVPSETTFPTPPPKPKTDTDTEEQGEAQATTSELDQFMAYLAETMMATLKDQGNPAALVPIFMKMPGEHIANLRLLEFWGKIDENAKVVRTDAIHRFFDGMDLPREQMAGMSGSGGSGGKSNGTSHWQAWQIEEQTIKMHVEPMAEVLTNALTLSFLRPLTKTLEVFTFDSSALRLRPDRSESSIELTDRFLLKGVRTLEENGFSGDDQMDEEELKKRLLIKIATGSSTPEQVAAANALLGVNLPVPQTPQAPQATREAPQDPSLEDHPRRPRTPAESASLVPVSEALVLRTLERAGNRIRQEQKVKPPGVPAFAMHTVYPPNGSADTLLDGAWNTAPVVLDGVVDDVDKMIAVLDSYCRSLFATQTEHSRQRLASFLEATC